jgi:hypothetical protein
MRANVSCIAISILSPNSDTNVDHILSVWCYGRLSFVVSISYLLVGNTVSLSNGMARYNSLCNKCQPLAKQLLRIHMRICNSGVVSHLYFKGGKYENKMISVRETK